MSKSHNQWGYMFSVHYGVQNYRRYYHAACFFKTNKNKPTSVRQIMVISSLPQLATEDLQRLMSQAENTRKVATSDFQYYAAFARKLKVATGVTWFFGLGDALDANNESRYILAIDKPPKKQDGDMVVENTKSSMFTVVNSAKEVWEISEKLIEINYAHLYEVLGRGRPIKFFLDLDEDKADTSFANTWMAGERILFLQEVLPKFFNSYKKRWNFSRDATSKDFFFFRADNAEKKSLHVISRIWFLDGMDILYQVVAPKLKEYLKVYPGSQDMRETMHNMVDSKVYSSDNRQFRFWKHVKHVHEDKRDIFLRLHGEKEIERCLEEQMWYTLMISVWGKIGELYIIAKPQQEDTRKAMARFASTVYSKRRNSTIPLPLPPEHWDKQAIINMGAVLKPTLGKKKYEVTIVHEGSEGAMDGFNKKQFIKEVLDILVQKDDLALSRLGTLLTARPPGKKLTTAVGEIPGVEIKVATKGGQPRLSLTIDKRKELENQAGLSKDSSRDRSGSSSSSSSNFFEEAPLRGEPSQPSVELRRSQEDLRELNTSDTTPLSLTMGDHIDKGNDPFLAPTPGASRIWLTPKPSEDEQDRKRVKLGDTPVEKNLGYLDASTPVRPICPVHHVQLIPTGSGRATSKYAERNALKCPGGTIHDPCTFSKKHNSKSGGDSLPGLGQNMLGQYYDVDQKQLADEEEEEGGQEEFSTFSSCLPSGGTLDGWLKIHREQASEHPKDRRENTEPNSSSSSSSSIAESLIKPGEGLKRGACDTPTLEGKQKAHKVSVSELGQVINLDKSLGEKS